MSKPSSKYQQYTENYIYPHKHCPVCSKMIGEDETYCSPECEGKTKQKGKKSKRQIFMFVGIYAVTIVGIIALLFFLK